MKLEVPKFYGEDPLTWISHIERFFNFHSILEHLRLQIAAFHLEGPAVVWFGLMENNNLITNWQSFLKEVRTYFGPTVYDDPHGHLSKLLLTSIVEDYHKSFE